MDRYRDYGVRSDADEQIRRGFRDAFKAAGLSHAQFLEALTWYGADGRHLGADPIRLAESFHNFATSKGWSTEHLVAGRSIYDAIAEHGPAAVLAPTTAEEDAATIAKADELLRTDPDSYWRDVGLQELALEARERQQAAPPTAPSVDDYAIERRIGQQDVDRFARMLREEPGKYWSSPQLQEQHRAAIAASIQEAPAGEQPGPAPASVTPAAAAPATAAEPPPRTEGAPP